MTEPTPSKKPTVFEAEIRVVQHNLGDEGRYSQTDVVRVTVRANTLSEAVQLLTGHMRVVELAYVPTTTTEGGAS